MLQKCCLLIATLALGTEAALVDQASAQRWDNLQIILQNLRQLCPDEIRLARAIRHRHEAEVRRQNLPDDVVQEEVEATLYRDLCGVLPIPTPLPVMPCGKGMTADAFLAVFPGAGWMTAREIVERLDRAKYGGTVWRRRPSTRRQHMYGRWFGT
jgi:hypothetical protein